MCCLVLFFRTVLTLNKEPTKEKNLISSYVLYTFDSWNFLLFIWMPCAVSPLTFISHKPLLVTFWVPWFYTWGSVLCHSYIFSPSLSILLSLSLYIDIRTCKHTHTHTHAHMYARTQTRTHMPVGKYRCEYAYLWVFYFSSPSDLNPISYDLREFFGPIRW